jgi:hypothetical protein
MLPLSYQVPAGIVLVVVGLLACFAGYRLFRLVLTVYGFVLGALFASTLVAPSDTAAILVALVVGGCLGAAVLFAGYFVGVMVVGAGLGAVVAHGVWTAWRGVEPGVAVTLACAVIGGALAVGLQRYMVIVATAFGGAQTVVAGFVAFLSQHAPRRGGDAVWIGHLGTPFIGRQWTFLAWVALGFLGTAFQIGSTSLTRGHRKK